MFAPYLAAAACFQQDGLGASDVTTRVRSVAVLLSCCVAFCMRRLKWAFAGP